LVRHIDNLIRRESVAAQRSTGFPEWNSELLEVEEIPNQVYPSWVGNISRKSEVSTTPRDLTEDQQADQIVWSAEQFVK
jgi:hypothetical protein